jgi:hypothetical protein
MYDCAWMRSDRPGLTGAWGKREYEVDTLLCAGLPLERLLMAGSFQTFNFKRREIKANQFGHHQPIQNTCSEFSRSEGVAAF